MANRPGDLKRMNMTRKCLRKIVLSPSPPRMADGSTSGLTFVGVFRGALHFPKARTVTQCDIWVVEGLAQPILSRQACFDLAILKSEHLRGGEGNKAHT